MLGALWLPQHQLHRHLKLEQHQQHLLGQAAARSTSSEHKTSASSPRTEAPGICLAPGEPPSEPPPPVGTWGQGLLQLLGLLLVRDDQRVQVPAAAHLELHIVLVLLDLDGCTVGERVSGTAATPARSRDLSLFRFTNHAWREVFSVDQTLRTPLQLLPRFPPRQGTQRQPHLHGAKPNPRNFARTATAVMSSPRAQPTTAATPEASQGDRLYCRALSASRGKFTTGSVRN